MRSTPLQGLFVFQKHNKAAEIFLHGLRTDQFWLNRDKKKKIIQLKNLTCLNTKTIECFVDRGM